MNKNGCGIVLIVIGAILLFIGLVVGGVFSVVGYSSKKALDEYEEEFSDFKKDADKYKGEVTEIGDGYTIIEFEDDDGEDCEIYLPSSSSSYPEGERVTVYCDPDSDVAFVPDIETSGLETFGYLFTVLGMGILTVFGVIGLILIICGIVSLKKHKKNNAAEFSTANLNGENVDINNM